MSDDTKSFAARAKEAAEKVRQDREEKLGKITAKDNLLSDAGDLVRIMLAADSAWDELFDAAIAQLERLVNTVDGVKKRDRDRFARIMTVYDSTEITDISAESFEESVERARDRVIVLKSMKEDFEKEFKPKEEAPPTEQPAEGKSGRPSDEPVVS